MTKASPLTVRGRRALTLVRDAREMAVVRRQLERLGMIVVEPDPGLSGSPGEPVDLVILDADALSVDQRPSPPMTAPVIVLVGTETPSRLKFLLEMEPASFLVKPLRSAGLYTAIVFALDRAQKEGQTARRIERLEERVRARRIVLAAIIEIMRRHALSEGDAFALIRRAAMVQRTTVERLSAEIASLGDLPGFNAHTA
jgi:AmiR/NasT family two-component response regulator